jgi:hypothetical protein
LLLREPDDDGPEEVEAGEFSALSYCTAELAQSMIERGTAFVLTFVCGSHKDTRGTSEGLNNYLLRSFCYQLLCALDMRSDATEFCNSKKVFRAI